MDLKGLDRDQLIEKGVLCGYRKEDLQRLPEYTIISRIKSHQESCISHKSENSDSESSEPHEKVKSPVHDHSNNQSNNQPDRPIFNAKFQFHQTTHDSETVIDETFTYLNAKDPAEQKFRRFSEFLIPVKNDLEQAVKINTHRLQSYQDKLDQDDIEQIERNINHLKQQIELTVAEMKQIYQWFIEVHAQKETLYNDVASNFVDFSGELYNHFSNKLNNMKQYMLQMQRDIKFVS